MRIINISTIHHDTSPVHRIPWTRHSPEANLGWNGWRFIINGDKEDYDYLVVADDLHAPIKLRCAPERTIHAGGEPPSVHRYRPSFLRQFAWVITQDTRIRHPGRILHQPGLAWFIGWQPNSANPNGVMSYKELEALFDVPKTKLISVISSNKTISSDHLKRFEFVKKLKAHYGEKIDLYGRGHAPIEDKLTALKEYRFHVALENSSFNHYFSEKLTDCVIAGAYPIYYGCPNLKEYFPRDSFVRININRFASCIRIIDDAIRRALDKRNRRALRTARDLAMQKHNFLPMIINIINGIEAGKYGSTRPPETYNGEMLPFGHQKFHTLFGPKYVHPVRKFLRSLIKKYGFFRFLYGIYCKLKRRQ